MRFCGPAVLLVALGASLGCVPDEPELPDDVLLNEDFAEGIWEWTDWHDSPGWVQPRDEALVIQPRVADHHDPAFGGDDEFTFGGLAAYCPKRDSDGRCDDPSEDWGSFLLEVDVNVKRQIREPLLAGVNLPAAWEVGWLFFRFKDVQHYYFMIFKTHHARDLEQDYGGVELGKYNCSRNCGIFGVQSGKETLFEINAAESPGETADFLELDRWYRYRIEVRNGTSETGQRRVSIRAFIDGTFVGAVEDDGTLEPIFGGGGATAPLTTGSIGLYAEDSEVWYDNLVVRRLE